MLPEFHPRLQEILVEDGWTELSEIQREAAPVLLAGGHALLIAPTGHGKTEAALLPVLSRILTERERAKAWPSGFKAVYVTPLRALNRDLENRLQRWGKALNLRIEVRHGDTTPSVRARQSRNPPDVLITTPETLQLLLYGDKLRAALRTVRFLIVDEVHDLLQSERGSQLSLALERIEEVVGELDGPEERLGLPSTNRPSPFQSLARPDGGFQRIGLSATVEDPELVQRFLVGPTRMCQLVRVEAKKEWELEVQLPRPTPEEEPLAADLSLPVQVYAELQAIRTIIDAHASVLVFHNTRDGAELLANRSAILDTRAKRPPLLGLHHGSLSSEVREDMENRFRSGELKALVATSSLELGIDVGHTDHVIQVHSPRSVSRMVQRLGRAGHRLGEVSRGTLLASGIEDAWECLAVATMIQEGRLEPLPYRPTPLVVLANQLVAMANEYARIDPEWAYQVVSRSYAFSDLDPSTFQAVYDTVLEYGTLRGSEAEPKVIGRSGRARRHFLEHVSMIPDERTYRVVDESSKRTIGTVDDAFVSSVIRPGQVLVMAGRSWTVLEIQVEEERVRVGPAPEVGDVPSWSGSLLPVSFELARQVLTVRRWLMESPEQLPIQAEVAETLRQPLQDHLEQDLLLPTDRLVTIETGFQRTVVHSGLGTRGNEALGRLTQALLEQSHPKTTIGMKADAYRITLTNVPRPDDIVGIWHDIDVPTVEFLLGHLLRQSPLLRHHGVHVAKQFGALPKFLDPNRTSRAKLDALLDDPVLGEEALSRLLHDRFDLRALTWFLNVIQDHSLAIQIQGMGPLSTLADVETGRQLQSPRESAELIRIVSERLKRSDVLLVCLGCEHQWPSRVDALPQRIKCRRCGSTMIAVLRPWNEELPKLLFRREGLTHQETLERDRIRRGASLVAQHGKLAVIAMVARGVGPDTAGRILSASGREGDDFYRDLIEAELRYARTNAFWKRGS